MLQWTASGAVSAPVVVQIRVQQPFPGRVAAGAPCPSRAMTTAEVCDNLAHFTTGLCTPRTRPCTGLVLSGQGVAARKDLAEILQQARQVGVERVVLHADLADALPADLPAWTRQHCTLVLPLQPGAGLVQAESTMRHAQRVGLALATNTLLNTGALPALDGVIQLLLALQQHRHTFTFPFPTGPRSVAAAPSPSDAVAILSPHLDRLLAAGLSPSVKGLPACYLGRHHSRLGRTGNRWYVDADHQGDDALLFFPDVVAFTKREVCRFCQGADQCDGFFSAYLQRGDAPALRPLQDLSSDT